MASDIDCELFVTLTAGSEWGDKGGSPKRGMTYPLLTTDNTNLSDTIFTHSWYGSLRRKQSFSVVGLSSGKSSGGESGTSSSWGSSTTPEGGPKGLLLVIGCSLGWPKRLVLALFASEAAPSWFTSKCSFVSCTTSLNSAERRLIVARVPT